MATRYIIAGAVVGLGVGGAVSYFYLRQQQQRAVRSDGGSGFAALASHPCFKYGMPVGDRLRVFSHYAASFDTRLRNPRWVLEHISPDRLAIKDGNRKNSEFVEDAGIEPRFRSKLDDYKGSGYDRGHMAPASNHKSSQDAMDDTFTLTNISPQVGAGFNRDYWARFERFVQDLTKHCDDVWVVTGPLYLPERAPAGMPGFVMHHRMIGVPPQLMAVPTHFFKVVLGEFGNGRKAAVGAFVMPNAAIDPDVPLASFAVPLGALEEVSGLRFFPAYLSDQRRLAVDETAIAVQQLGVAQLRLLKPGLQPLMLPVPDDAQQRVPPPAVVPGSGPLMIPPTDQQRSLGAVHLCEHTECRLPAERFWESNGGAAASKGGSGKRALRRTLSSPQ